MSRLGTLSFAITKRPCFVHFAISHICFKELNAAMRNKALKPRVTPKAIFCINFSANHRSVIRNIDCVGDNRGQTTFSCLDSWH